ncbi:transporter [Flavobacterium sp. '19STA2R22 D10 B1']|uniref:transporter n=1 Tax=Flavobacterium aerium TaxID=3037261 RepID=UPI00278C8C74|nr:transporter [Flavobacterium sp. '19STA2R22 D10 B1']
MSQFKSLLLFVAVITSSSIYAQFTDVINSNRPGASMSAFSVGKTVFQTEAGIFAIKQSHDVKDYDANGFGFDLSLRYGAFLEQLEFIADMQYVNDKLTQGNEETKRSALKSTTIGAKYLIYDPFKNYKEKINIYSWKANQKFKWRSLIPAVSVYAGANVNFSDNPYTFPTDPKFSPKVMLITQNHFAGKWVFVTNIIADKIGTDYPSYGYIITLTRGFNEKWSGFLENQGYKSDFYGDAIFRGGAAYLIKENIQIDASISKNIKDTPSILYGGIGISWRFDKNYKDIIIEGGKETKTDKKSKGEKDKKNKRVDEIEAAPAN